jgi:hypothetical protein
MDWVQLGPVLALLSLLSLELALQRHGPQARGIFLLSGAHLTGFLAIPLLAGPHALHLGLWDGLFALALIPIMGHSSRSPNRQLALIGGVFMVAHLAAAAAPTAPPSELVEATIQGIGLIGFGLLALRLHQQHQLTSAFLALLSGLVAWTGPDQWLALGCKAAFVISLVQDIVQRRKDEQRLLEDALVQSANQLELPFRMTAQALFHVPVPILLVEAGSREVLYANGMARATLRQTDWSRRPLSSLFLALQPAGGHQEEALLLEQEGLIQRVLLHAIPAPGEAGSLEIISVTPAALHSDHLSRLLIEEHMEIHGTGRCLTDSRFSIVAASAGWQHTFGRLDRYFQSGVVWDKLRMANPEASLLLRAELELERTRRTRFTQPQLHGPSLQIEAMGFRDAEGAKWYLFQISPPR